MATYTAVDEQIIDNLLGQQYTSVISGQPYTIPTSKDTFKQYLSAPLHSKTLTFVTAPVLPVFNPVLQFFSDVDVLEKQNLYLSDFKAPSLYGQEPYKSFLSFGQRHIDPSQQGVVFGAGENWFAGIEYQKAEAELQKSFRLAFQAFSAAVAVFSAFYTPTPITGAEAGGVPPPVTYVPGSEVPIYSTGFGSTTGSLEAARLGLGTYTGTTPAATAIAGAAPETGLAVAGFGLNPSVAPFAGIYTPVDQYQPLFNVGGGSTPIQAYGFGNLTSLVRQTLGNVGDAIIQVASGDLVGAGRSLGIIKTPTESERLLDALRKGNNFGAGGGGGVFLNNAPQQTQAFPIMGILTFAVIGFILFLIIRKR